MVEMSVSTKEEGRISNREEWTVNFHYVAIGLSGVSILANCGKTDVGLREMQEFLDYLSTLPNYHVPSGTQSIPYYELEEMNKLVERIKPHFPTFNAEVLIKEKLRDVQPLVQELYNHMTKAGAYFPKPSKIPILPSILKRR